MDEGEKYNLPNVFLMEMMEINELLDEGKKAAEIPGLKELEASIVKEVDELVKKKSGAFSEADYEILKSCYYRKKYIQRILDRLHDWCNIAIQIYCLVGDPDSYREVDAAT